MVYIIVTPHKYLQNLQNEFPQTLSSNFALPIRIDIALLKSGKCILATGIRY